MNDDPDNAEERRRRLKPDITFGRLALWVGNSRGRTWLDIALRVGDEYETLAENQGPLLQRRDLKAFPEILAEFENQEDGEVQLTSDGAGLAIALKRYAHSEANYCIVQLRRGDLNQRISFAVTRSHLTTALADLRAVIERIEREDAPRWRPTPQQIDMSGEEDPATAWDGPAAPPLVKPPSPPLPPAEPWDAGLGEGEMVAFDYVVDGVGWFAVTVRAGPTKGGFGGSSWITDAMGDLLRAGLALLAGAARAEVICDAEPFITRVEFERVLLKQETGRDGRLREIHGCWIRIREIDHQTEEPGPAEFEALCRSPRQVAEALYRMALPHFADHARSDYLTMAALEGALQGVQSAERHGR